MSSYSYLKPKIKGSQTKSKKCKFPFIFNLEEIDKMKNNSKSLDKKKEINNKITNNNIRITNNIIKIKIIDDMKVLPLKNVDYIYTAWKESKLFLENFEKKILNRSDFEINYKTYEIITKNEKACSESKDEKFWILYSDYLIKYNKIKNYKDFLKVMNLAFSNLDFDCKLLIYYYLDKIKKFNPIISNEIIEEKDEPYIDLLDDPVKYRLKRIRRNLISDIKFTLNKKYYNTKKKENFYQYTPFS